MNLAKRVGLYTIRHKIKSSILFLTLLIISTFVLTGIAIENAVTETATNVRTSLGGEITLWDGGPLGHLDLTTQVSYILESRLDELLEENSNPYRLTSETLEAILAIPEVVDYNITNRDAFVGTPENFNFISADFGFSADHDLFWMYSVTNSERMEGFTNGNLRLEYGRHLTAADDRTVLISEELAELNNINVGDVLKLSGTSTGGMVFVTTINEAASRPRTTMEFEVVGIFSGTRGSTGFMQALLPSNQLITALASPFDSGSSDILSGTLSVFVEDPLDIESVFSEIATLPEVYGRNFTLTMGTEGFEMISAPLESLQGLVFTMIIIIVVVSLAILSILLTIWILGRIKEIGIFLSIGIKKRKIITQFILEAILIAVIAFTLALPISQVTTQGAGDFIIEQFTSAQELQNEQGEQASEGGAGAGGVTTMRVGDGLMGPAPTIENTLDQINVAVSAHDLMWVYVIGLPLIIGSVLIASYTVVKLKPREILSKMS